MSNDFGSRRLIVQFHAHCYEQESDKLSLSQLITNQLSNYNSKFEEDTVRYYKMSLIDLIL